MPKKSKRRSKQAKRRALKRSERQEGTCFTTTGEHPLLARIRRERLRRHEASAHARRLERERLERAEERAKARGQGE